MPTGKKATKKKSAVKRSKTDLAQEKLENEITEFEKNHELHGAFINRINNWIRAHNSRAIDLFRKFDKDGDGSLSFSEFQAGMWDLNAPCSNIELHVLSRLLDQNNDGMLDYLEFAKGVRYYKPEETLPDDGLPILRIHREDLEQCPNCKLKLWKPSDTKFPRFVQIDMKLLTFLRIHNYPGHFRVLVHTHVTIQGLIDVINDRHGGTLRFVRVYDEDVQGNRIDLDPHKTLEDCGYLGGPKHKPQKLELIYDYTTEFHECPLLMADDYFAYDNPKSSKFLL